MLSLRTDVKRIDPEDQRTALWRVWMCCDAFLMIHSGNPWESKQSLRTVFRIQKDSPCYQKAKFGLWTSWEYFDIFLYITYTLEYVWHLWLVEESLWRTERSKLNVPVPQGPRTARWSTIVWSVSVCRHAHYAPSHSVQTCQGYWYWYRTLGMFGRCIQRVQFDGV